MFQGSLVALVTPMRESGEVDYASLRELVDWHVQSGTDAIVATGTTGEAPTLTTDEQLTVIRTVVEQAAGRISVIAGTGSNATDKTIQITRKAMEIGVEACLLVTPYYNKPTQEGLYRHYRAVAEAVPIPQILYNVPGRTGCDLLPTTVTRLATVPNIVAIKEGKPEHARAIIEACGKSIDVFSGDDVTALEIISAGGKGVISVTANVAPADMHVFCEAALASNFALAEQLNNKLLALHKDLFVETNPIPVKWALYKMGKIPAGIRLPLTPLAEAFHEKVLAAMRQANITIEE